MYVVPNIIVKSKNPYVFNRRDRGEILKRSVTFFRLEKEEKVSSQYPPSRNNSSKKKKRKEEIRSPPTTPVAKNRVASARRGANVIIGVVIVPIIVMVADDRRHPPNGRATNISPFNDWPDQQVVCFLNDTTGSRNRGNI